VVAAALKMMKTESMMERTRLTRRNWRKMTIMRKKEEEITLPIGWC
jgi:hypothetical protein